MITSSISGMQDFNVLTMFWLDDQISDYRLPTNRRCHSIALLRGISSSQDKLIGSFNNLLVNTKQSLVHKRKRTKKTKTHHPKVFAICRSGGLGFPSWGDPSRPGLCPEQCDWQVKADLICGGGSLKTDHYHTTWDRWDETLAYNTTDGTPQHLKGSSLSLVYFPSLSLRIP